MRKVISGSLGILLATVAFTPSYATPNLFSAPKRIPDVSPSTPIVISVRSNNRKLFNAPYPVDGNYWECSWKRGTVWFYSQGEVCPAVDPSIPIVAAKTSLDAVKAPAIAEGTYTKITQVYRVPHVGSNITYAGMSFTGATFLRSDGLANSLNLSDMRFKDINAIVDSTDATASYKSISIQRIDATVKGTRGCLKFRGGITSAIIEDFTCIMTGMTTQGDIAAGIQFGGKATTDVGTNITIRRARLSGAQQEDADFLNGDGIALEKGYTKVRIEDVTVDHNIDAGLDWKCLKDCTGAWIISAFNRRNFKNWYNIVYTGPIWSFEPGQPGDGAPAHIIVVPGDPTKGYANYFEFQDIHFQSANKTPLFVNGETKYKAIVVVKGVCDRSGVSADTPLTLSKNISITGCK